MYGTNFGLVTSGCGDNGRGLGNTTGAGTGLRGPVSLDTLLGNSRGATVRVGEVTKDGDSGGDSGVGDVNRFGDSALSDVGDSGPCRPMGDRADTPLRSCIVDVTNCRGGGSCE